MLCFVCYTKKSLRKECVTRRGAGTASTTCAIRLISLFSPRDAKDALQLLPTPLCRVSVRSLLVPIRALRGSDALGAPTQNQGQTRTCDVVNCPRSPCATLARGLSACKQMTRSKIDSAGAQAAQKRAAQSRESEYDLQVVLQLSARGRSSRERAPVRSCSTRDARMESLEHTTGGAHTRCRSGLRARARMRVQTAIMRNGCDVRASTRETAICPGAALIWRSAAAFRVLFLAVFCRFLARAHTLSRDRNGQCITDSDDSPPMIQRR